MLSPQEIKERLIAAGFEGRVSLNTPLGPLTYYKIGGPADMVADAATVLDVGILKSIIDSNNIDSFVLGAGSNILVSDAGFRGIVIRLDGEFTKLEKYPDEYKIKSGAAVPLGKLLREGASKGLAGIERLAGIPGLVGGAIFMNAGTFGEHIGDLTESVEILTPSGEHVTLGPEDCDFSYRTTRFQESGEIILACTLVSRFKHPSDIEKLIAEKMDYRKKSQPIDVPSCGCVFRNPDGKKSAAILIQESGLKGLESGGAVISKKHGNFIVNIGNAKASDVIRLIASARKQVLHDTGVTLEAEVRIIGFAKSLEEMLDEQS